MTAAGSVHPVAAAVAPCPSLAVPYLPAVPSCLVAEVRVIYVVFLSMSDHSPRMRPDAYMPVYLMYVVAQQLRLDVERSRHDIAVSVMRFEASQRICFAVLCPVPSVIVSEPV